MGWSNSKEFKKKMSGTSIFVPCLKKNFGIPCRHCELSRELYKKGDEDGGKALYAKKTIWSWAYILKAPESSIDFEKKLVLFNWPVRVVDKIIEKVEETEEELAWSVPSDLKEGGALILTKKKGEQFANYSVDYLKKPISVENVWPKFKKKMFDITNLSKICSAIFGEKVSTFRPVNDLSFNERVKVRLLPIPGKEDLIPFTLIWGHVVDALLPMDEYALEVGYDKKQMLDYAESLETTTDNEEDDVF